MRRPPISGLVLLLSLACLTAATPRAHANSPPVVTNVVAQQVASTGNVRITFDVSDADNDPVTARVICSSNNGSAFDLMPVTVSGDVNQSMPVGPGKQIIWNAAADYQGRSWSQVVAKVYVSDGAVLSGEMVSVPAGNFTMGGTVQANEQPVHTIYLDAFLIDKYEVTNAEFKQFIDAGGYATQAFWSVAGWSERTSRGWTQPAFWGDDNYRSGQNWPGFPVLGVSWYEAEAYANFAGKRLPTEAEWEKAARGTDQREYPWGNSALDGTRANYLGSGDPYEYGGTQPTPVGFYDGRLHPNPPFQTTNSPSFYGAYDMAGNVLEWVGDWYQADYYSVTPPSNPRGPLSGVYRVLRGGAWANGTTYLYTLRCAGRGIDVPSDRINYAGLRCARTSP